MQYRSIDRSRNELRLLTVQRARIKNPSLIRCKLEHVSLDSLKQESSEDGPRRSSQVPAYTNPISGMWNFKVAGIDLTYWSLMFLPFLLSFLFYYLTLISTSDWRIYFILVVLNVCQFKFACEITFKIAIMLNYTPSQANLLTLIRDRVYWSIIAGAYPSVRAIMLFIMILTTLWYRWPRTDKGAFALDISRYAAQLQKARYGWHPNTSSFRFEWGDYVALSYAWGNQSSTSTRDIIVNGKRMHVTENLESFLRWWQSSWECRKGLKLWVDSLCIDQQNMEERSNEVRRMGIIYATAWRVFAWLGPSHTDSDHAVDFIVTLSIRSYTLKDPTQFASPWGRKSDKIRRRDLRALQSLLSRPYWQRTWIIQELMFGGPRTQCVCGSRIVSWGQICDVARFLTDARGVLNDEQKQYLTDSSYSELLMLLHHICDLQDLMRAENAPKHLLLEQICRLAQSSEATNAADKVYAFLGLFPQEIFSSIVPNYSLSARHTYVSYTKSIIAATGDLKFILIGNRSATEDSWPSWVPDLRVPPDPHQLQIAIDDIYHTSGDSRSRVDFIGSELLRCLGFKITTVPKRDASEAISLDREDNDFYTRSDQETENTIIRMLSSFTGQDAIEKSTPSVTDSSSHIESKKLQTHRSRAVNDFMTRELDLTPSILHPNSNLKNKDIIERSMLALESMSRATKALNSRKVIGCVENQLVWSAHEVQADDVICVLLGCDYPVVLRRRHMYYKVIGECYIYGRKDGELMDSLKAGRYTLDSFVLC